MTNLHEQALQLAKIYKKTEIELVDVLQKIDLEKLFLKLGYTSLFEYCLKALGLPEGTCYNFINVARKAREFPELKQALQSGEILVSKARKITAVMTKETQNEWISKAQTLSTGALEKEVARVLPSELTPEKVKYVQEKRINMNFGVSEELYSKLKRVQDLECQRNQSSPNLEETLNALVDVYLFRNDPVEKAKQILNKSARKNTVSADGDCQKKVSDCSREQFAGQSEEKSVPTRVALKGQVSRVKQKQSRTKRIPLPAKLKHQVFLRDQGKCSQANCADARWIQIHHIKPVSEGGFNKLENLTTLCWAHHKMIHRH